MRSHARRLVLDAIGTIAGLIEHGLIEHGLVQHDPIDTTSSSTI
ncbi:MAG: hypothetical protein R2710_01820 [Acidimicrobiales bacterium]